MGRSCRIDPVYHCDFSLGLNDTDTREIVDLIVIGGGVNGVGVARDAAGRGLSVVLCEKDDLASHTSSSSTKLIHGGLRYLEHYDFKLVRHSLKEREVLLKSAPHIIWPMRFILPHHSDLRPRWLIRIGLFLYDHLSRREVLPGSRSLKLQSNEYGAPLQDAYTHAFEYADCWVQDARLVILNAIDARERGAHIMTRTACTGIVRESEYWRVTLRNQAGEQNEIHARTLVNAAGPWVENVSRLSSEDDSGYGVRLVKGSHIIVNAMFEHDAAYIFQNGDGRIMFAIPYESVYTLIGTTDVQITSDPGQVEISDQEIRYLCDNANRYFRQQIGPADVVHTYSGVRPLFDDASENASKTTRDYVLHLDDDGPPVVAIYGGKLTTYRKLAEDVLALLAKAYPSGDGEWTESATLPGGDIDVRAYDEFATGCVARYRWLPAAVVRRLARNYGSRIHDLIGEASDINDMGVDFGYGLFEREVEYLIDQEWARDATDVLVRRTKLGLHGGEALHRAVDSWFAGRNMPG